MAEDLQHRPDVVPSGSMRDEEELRALAQKRLKDKRDFVGHLISYITVNALLIGIWWTTGHGFFWPVFILLGWGIGIVFHAWDVLSPGPGPAQIEAEMERLRRRGI